MSTKDLSSHLLCDFAAGSFYLRTYTGVPKGWKWDRLGLVSILENLERGGG